MRAGALARSVVHPHPRSLQLFAEYALGGKKFNLVASSEGDETEEDVREGIAGGEVAEEGFEGGGVGYGRGGGEGGGE